MKSGRAKNPKGISAFRKHYPDARILRIGPQDIPLEGFFRTNPRDILGELACGGMKNRHEIIGLLNDLPSTEVLDHHDIMEFIENRKIMNKGIGYIDVHLLGSALVSGTPVWTFDKTLRKIANQLSIEYDSV
ncbi:MAG: VapC toxin family PIN domain ribonuclease [Deltaproteobacteria bacterium]|nr:VapC toxin family PIN domain ribonuclease [Deltaproteobacteria bacterium]